MDTKKFNEIVERRIDKIRSVLMAKADEYVRGDRLSNFKQAASLTTEKPIEVLAGLVAKHEVAFHNFVNDWGLKNTIQAYDRWDEKIGDIINYMILADAITIEYLENNGLEILKEKGTE